MYLPVRFRPRDAGPLARSGRDLRIERHGQLQGQKGRPVARGMEEGRIFDPAFGFGPYGPTHLHALSPEHLGSAARFTSRVCSSIDETPDPCPEQRMGARRGLSVMIARLERHVCGGPLGGAASHLQRHDLGMRATEALVEALSHAHAVPHDHAPDHRVRVDVPPALPRERACAFEMDEILRGGGRGGRAHGVNRSARPPNGVPAVGSKLDPGPPAKGA